MTVPEQKKHVQVCRLWQRGAAGSACLFAHAPELSEAREARVQRNAASSESSRRSWAELSEDMWPQGDPAEAAADAPQDARPTAGVPQVCQAWQRACCYAGDSCLFRHGPSPCAVGPVVLEHSSIVSSSRSWLDGSGSREDTTPRAHEDHGPDPLPDARGVPLYDADREASVQHWVWGSSASSSVASHSSRPSADRRRRDAPPEAGGGAARGGPGDEERRDGSGEADVSGGFDASRSASGVDVSAERESPDVSGDGELPRFDARVDIPEFIPGLTADDGHLDKAPLSKSAKRRRERKLAEKRRDMRRSNESILGPIVEAMRSLSRPCIDEARRQRPAGRARGPPGAATSPRLPVPPTTPRWKVNRNKMNAGDGEGDGDDFEEAMSQEEHCRDDKGSLHTFSL